MSRVLLITYYYPPRRGIGGLRPAGLAKYLPEFGWEPLVLTPALPPGAKPRAQVVETGYQDVLGRWKSLFGLDSDRGLHEQLELPQSLSPGRDLLHSKAIYWLKSWLTYPDLSKGWLKFGREEILKLQPSGSIDVILSTAPPITCHLLGLEAKRILDRPWVADCRDLFVPSGGGKVHARLGRSLEKRTLRHADALVTVSEPWAELMRTFYPDRPVADIVNGFDAEDFASVPTELIETFSITYTGELYRGRRDPSPLFEVLAELLESGAMVRERVSVRFYGSIDPWLKAAIERYGLRGVVKACGPVPRQEALLHQRESQINLLLGIEMPYYSGGIPGKLFEYLAAGRPILGLGTEQGVVGEILRRTSAGVFTTTKEEVREFVLSAYREFLGTGKVAYRGSQAAIDKYTHREMARKFSHVLTDTNDRFSAARSRQASNVVSIERPQDAVLSRAVRKSGS